MAKVTADFAGWRRKREAIKPALRDALNSANNNVKDVAQQLAPVSAEGSGGNPPGFLRDNIVVTKEATVDDLRASTASLARYSEEVEFGTVEHGDAQPFMSPAFELGKHELADRVKGII